MRGPDGIFQMLTAAPRFSSEGVEVARLAGRAAGKSIAVRLEMDLRIARWFRDNPDAAEIRIHDAVTGETRTIPRPTPRS